MENFELDNNKKTVQPGSVMTIYREIEDGTISGELQDIYVGDITFDLKDEMIPEGMDYIQFDENATISLDDTISLNGKDWTVIEIYANIAEYANRLAYENPEVSCGSVVETTLNGYPARFYIYNATAEVPKGFQAIDMDCILAEKLMGHKKGDKVSYTVLSEHDNEVVIDGVYNHFDDYYKKKNLEKYVQEKEQKIR